MKNKNLIILCIIIICSVLPSCPFQHLSILDYTVYAKTLRCSKCGRKISGRFLKNSKGKVFCSKKCFSRSLPKCSICGRPSTMSSGKKHFCSQKCMKSTWPQCSNCKRRVKGGILRGLDKKFLCKACSNKPKCFSCYMPANFAKLGDGRYICKHCNKTSVSDFAKIKKIANEVRQLMKEQLHLTTDHDIQYRMVSLNDLQGKTKHKHKGIELGLYRFDQLVEKITTTETFLGKSATTTEEHIKEENHTIFFLYGIPEDKLREVAAHELAHDWMQEFYPDITDLKVKEGWAEYVASRVNIIYGRAKMNRRMEKNPDPIYGKGYRMIKKIADREDIDAIFKFFEKSK